MDNDFNQYIHSASDSLIYLREARDLILRDKHRIRYYPLVHAAFCRLLAIEIISSIELMIKRWGPGCITADLMAFIKPSGNIGKVEIFERELGKAGLTVDLNVLIDYTATKLLRNTVVHSDLSEDNAAFLEKNGFPRDITKLDENHWDRMNRAFDSMMLYIFTAANPRPR